MGVTELYSPIRYNTVLGHSGQKIKVLSSYNHERIPTRDLSVRHAAQSCYNNTLR
jgi:hypothetical protein